MDLVTVSVVVIYILIATALVVGTYLIAIGVEELADLDHKFVDDRPYDWSAEDI